MTASPLLHVNDLTVQLSGQAVLKGISFSLQQGERLAVIGKSGSGKTTLIKALAGQCFAGGTISFGTEKKPSIALIQQQHQFKNRSHINSFYYQQRFNSMDADDAETVRETLQAINPDETAIAVTVSMFGITHVMDTPLIQLSNGEHKRLQLAEAVLQKAEWILLDNPYTGLDVAARKMLNETLDALAAKGIHYLLVTSPADMPSSITHVAELKEGSLGTLVKKENYSNTYDTVSGTKNLHFINTCKTIPPAYSYPDFSVAIRMVNVHVQYHNRTILDQINWEVKKGECWSVSGHNGSGKSTLLSLVNGDNPQAFANEIYLFDKRKGSGESIWDIKQKIGYVSPELHHYFDAACSAYEVIASGLFDTIGLFRQLSASQKNIIDQWCDALQVAAICKKNFKQLSNGEQRMVLLARALVKNPPLLILDEPCQGLDTEIAARFNTLINTICVEMGKTLVYVSHYKEEIPSCVTHALELVQGRIAA
jgi:molybdate transport system ATP-binding protein